MAVDHSTARLIEVFSAIQGEGLNVGTRQIFIRFALCDLRCYFCDSAHTWSVPPICQIERSPGLRDFETHSNPVTLDNLLNWIDRQNQAGLHDSISVTGGEPLLHAPFLAQFLPQVRKRTGLPIYLETGGHRPDLLVSVLPYLDLVGMDVKLPSVSGEVCWEAHQEFLQRCYEANVEVFIKTIVSSQTNPSELEQMAELVASIDPKIPVFLQPVTPLADTAKPSKPSVIAPEPEQVLTWQGLMKRPRKNLEGLTLHQVRVVPQTHKMLGQL